MGQDGVQLDLCCHLRLDSSLPQVYCWERLLPCRRHAVPPTPQPSQGEDREGWTGLKSRVAIPACSSAAIPACSRVAIPACSSVAIPACSSAMTSWFRGQMAESSCLGFSNGQNILHVLAKLAPPMFIPI